MKNAIAILFVFALNFGVPLNAQGKAYSKELIKKEIDLTAFNAIEVSGLAQVFISKGITPKAYLEVSGVPIEEVRVVVEKETLKISTPSDYSGESVKIYITYKEISKLLVTDAAEIFSNGPIKTAKLEISCLDAGNAVLELDVDLVEILMKESADLTLTGFAKEQKTLSSSKNGTFDNSGLKLKE